MEGQDLPADFLDFLSDQTTDTAKSEEEREKSFIRRSVIQRNCHVSGELKAPSQGYHITLTASATARTNICDC